MRTTLPRCCATCVYFRRLPGETVGTCGHRQRRPQTDVWPLSRGRELPCRYDWSFDLWEVRPGGESEAGLRVVGLKAWGPFHGAPALDDLPNDLLGLLVRGALAGE